MPSLRPAVVRLGVVLVHLQRGGAVSLRPQTAGEGDDGRGDKDEVNSKGKYMTGGGERRDGGWRPHDECGNGEVLQRSLVHLQQRECTVRVQNRILLLVLHGFRVVKHRLLPVLLSKCIVALRTQTTPIRCKKCPARSCLFARRQIVCVCSDEWRFGTCTRYSSAASASVMTSIWTMLVVMSHLLSRLFDHNRRGKMEGEHPAEELATPEGKMGLAGVLDVRSRGNMRSVYSPEKHITSVGALRDGKTGRWSFVSNCPAKVRQIERHRSKD